MQVLAEETYCKLTQEELSIAKRMFAHDMPPSDIAIMLGKNKSTLTRRLCQRTPLKKQGRPVEVTEKVVDKVEARLNELVVKANGESPVTIEMVKRSCRVKCTDKTLLDRLHARGIYLRPMREKPTLTEQDVKDRYAFGKKYKDKPASFWRSYIHMHLDCKMFN